MESSTGTSVLAVLERAEMAARERRLAASTEAERILASARERAAAISATADAEVARALDDLRTRTERAADRIIDGLERVAATRARSMSLAGADGHELEAMEAREFEAAVEAVVAALLGEVHGPRRSGDAPLAQNAPLAPDAPPAQDAPLAQDAPPAPPTRVAGRARGTR